MENLEWKLRLCKTLKNEKGYLKWTSKPNYMFKNLWEWLSFDM